MKPGGISGRGLSVSRDLRVPMQIGKPFSLPHESQVKIMLKLLMETTDEKKARIAVNFFVQAGDAVVSMLKDKLYLVDDVDETVRDRLIAALTKIGGEPVLKFIPELLVPLWYKGGKEILERLPQASEKIAQEIRNFNIDAIRPDEERSFVAPALRLSFPIVMRALKFFEDHQPPADILDLVYAIYKRASIQDMKNQHDPSDCMIVISLACEFKCYAEEVLIRYGGPAMALKIVSDPEIPVGTRCSLTQECFWLNKPRHIYTEEIVEPLKAAILDPGLKEFRDYFCVALGRTRSPKALPAIIAAMRGPDPILQDHAIEALSWLPGKEATQQIIDIFLEKNTGREEVIGRVRAKSASVVPMLISSALAQQAKNGLSEEVWIDIAKILGRGADHEVLASMLRSIIYTFDREAEYYTILFHRLIRRELSHREAFVPILQKILNDSSIPLALRKDCLCYFSEASSIPEAALALVSAIEMKEPELRSEAIYFIFEHSFLEGLEQLFNSQSGAIHRLLEGLRISLRLLTANGSESEPVKLDTIPPMDATQKKLTVSNIGDICLHLIVAFPTFPKTTKKLAKYFIQESLEFFCAIIRSESSLNDKPFTYLAENCIAKIADAMK
ncbi:HEAT repeat domain-containing protein [Candidatus Saganbacteria bacterium]|nr:HEAT repeat domain-containing protein [Candidatus Saganbacteria bacterium]